MRTLLYSDLKADCERTVFSALRDRLPELIAACEASRPPVDEVAGVMRDKLEGAADREKVTGAEDAISELLALNGYDVHDRQPGPIGDSGFEGQRLLYFRRGEADLIDAVAAGEPVVLATGREPRRLAREMIDAYVGSGRPIYAWTIASGPFAISQEDGQREFHSFAQPAVKIAVATFNAPPDEFKVSRFHLRENPELGRTAEGYPVHLATSRIGYADVLFTIVVDTCDDDGVAVPFDGEVGTEIIARAKLHIAEHVKLAGESAAALQGINPEALVNLIQMIVNDPPKDALFIIQDIDLYLDKDIAQRFASLMASMLRDTSIRLRRNHESRTQIVLLGADLALPSNLTSDVRHIELPLPTTRELSSEFRRRLVKNETWRDSVLAEGAWANNDDLLRLSQSAVGMTLTEAVDAVRPVLASSGATIERLLEAVRRAKGASIKRNPALEIVEVGDSNIRLGGMDRFEAWLTPRRKVFEHPDKARGAGILRPPRGVLLLGIPGSGKSLAAKELARTWGLTLVRLDMGALQDKYLGESERNIRGALRIVDAMSPCIVWIDEIDKGVAQDSYSSQTHQNVLATLLTWLQESRAPAFVIATANRFAGLPPELTRAGRFDGRFFFGCPAAEARAEILGIHLAARGQALPEDVITKVVATTDGFTGAELEQVVLDALYAAFDEDRPVAGDDLIGASQGIKPLIASVGDGLDEIWDLIEQGRVLPASDHMLSRTQLARLIDPELFHPMYCRLEAIHGWGKIGERAHRMLMDDPLRGPAAIVMDTGDPGWAFVQSNVRFARDDIADWKFIDRVDTMATNGVLDILVSEHGVDTILFETDTALDTFRQHPQLGAYSEFYQLSGAAKGFADLGAAGDFTDLDPLKATPK